MGHPLHPWGGKGGVAGICDHLSQGPPTCSTITSGFESWQSSWCRISYFNIPCLGLIAPIMHYRCKTVFAHLPPFITPKDMIVFHLNYQLLSGTLGGVTTVQPCVSVGLHVGDSEISSICVSFYSFLFCLFIYLSQSLVSPLNYQRITLPGCAPALLSLCTMVALFYSCC